MLWKKRRKCVMKESYEDYFKYLEFQDARQCYDNSTQRRLLMTVLSQIAALEAQATAMNTVLTTLAQTVVDGASALLAIQAKLEIPVVATVDPTAFVEAINAAATANLARTEALAAEDKARDEAEAAAVAAIDAKIG